MHEASGAINSVRRARIPSMQPAILLVSPARSLMFRQARPETDARGWCLPFCETFCRWWKISSSSWCKQGPFPCSTPGNYERTLLQVPELAPSFSFDFPPPFLSSIWGMTVSTRTLVKLMQISFAKIWSPDFSKSQLANTKVSRWSSGRKG